MSTPWAAIVGPIARPAPTGVIAVPHDNSRSLDKRYEFGAWTIRPGERQFVEYLRPEPHSLWGATQLTSWPIIVEGTQMTSPFDPEVHRRLHALAVLLALAWNEPWQLRSSPWPTNDLPAVVPDSWPPPPNVMDWSLDSRRNVVPLPAMVAEHWFRFESEPKRARASSMWHQGLLVEELHPSLALLAYVSVVETLGDQTIRSNRRRFRSAIERYLPEQRGSLDGVYSLRSAAVHASKLVGFEGFYGALADLGIPAGSADSLSVSELLGAASFTRILAREMIVSAWAT